MPSVLTPWASESIRIGTPASAAVRTGTMLEINSASDRRDLNDVYARAAASIRRSTLTA